MSNRRNVLTSLFHRLGVAGPVCLGVFAGIGAPEIAGGSGARTVGRRSVVAALVACVCALGVCLAVGVVPAGAEQAGVPQSFGSYGVGAGQIEEAHGIAIDQETGVDGQNGDVYVVDTNNQRLDEFGGDGEFVRAWGWGVDAAKPEARLQECTNATGCQSGEEGSGTGEFGNHPGGVAVDNTSGLLRDLSHGDVYVVDRSNARVEKFSATGQLILMFGGEVNATTHGDVCLAGEACQAGVEGTGSGQFAGLEGETIAVDLQGHMYVGDANRVQRFSEGGVYEATVLEGVGRIYALAVAPNDDVYVVSSGRAGVREYEPGGKEVGSPLDEPSEEERHNGRGPQSLTTNAAGDLFVDDIRGEGNEDVPHHILEYDAAGAQIASFDKTPSDEDGGTGIAVGEAAEAVYLNNNHNEDSGSVRYAYVRTTPLPPPGPSVIAASVAAAPETHNTASVKAQIDPESATEASEYWVEYGLKGSTLQKTAVQTLPASFEEFEVTVGLTGLAFSAEYDYCVRAKNAKGTTPCVLKSFVSLPATSIGAEWVSDVASSSATFAAEVNPEDGPTTCRFGYGTLASYTATGAFEHEVATSALAEGVEQTVSVHVQTGIEPGVEYAYRVSCEKESVTDRGGVQMFRGQLERRGVGLPDGRVLERVAAGGNGAGITAPYGSTPQAAEEGGAIVYARHSANTPGTVANRAPEWAVELARHSGAGGWSSIAMTPPYSFSQSTKTGTEYPLFSAGLTAAIDNPADAAGTPYRRTEAAGGLFGAPQYEPMFTAGNDPEGVVMGGTSNYVSHEALEGADASLEHVVFFGPAAILPGTVEHSLYEWSNGTVVPVSVLPADEEHGADVPATLSTTASHGDTRGAVSEDGALVFWSAGNGLYVRDTQTDESLRLDVALPGVTAHANEAQGIEFQFASADGSRVFFTSAQRLTPGSSAGKNPDLYECVIATAPTLSCHLSDLTEGVLRAGESANVRGLVLAASKEGNRIYFVATGELAAGASSGEDNLYGASEEDGVWHTSWIATLSGNDATDWAEGPFSISGMSQMTARASDDGEYLTFMSFAPLTGYDNIDAQAGVPDAEVYVYDTHSHKLVCVSCDPTGARPHGFVDETSAVVDYGGAWSGRWLGGMLAPWHSLAIGGRGLTPYQPRSIADSGRVFFESATALVPGASNGEADVYEFEPAGTGSCSASAPGFSEVTGGCVSLISPGTATGESAFIDASVNGDDVFVMTSEGAEAGLPVYAIYDAHSCEAGSSWSCASGPPSVSSPPCTTTESCRAAPVAQPSIYGAPSSATFSGAGNLASPAPVVAKKVVKKKPPARCAKGKKRDKRGVCVKSRKKAKRSSLRGKGGK